jgi:uncharacterized membrane protein YagU involved in acid resistance
MAENWNANQAQTLVYVLAGGLVAGTLDITYACVFWGLKAGASPQRIFQSVATGLLGPDSFKGGVATAALGLFLHYLIAISMSVAYYFVARRWAALREKPLSYGAAYGVVLYGVMNYIVVPLSAARGGGSAGGLWIALSILVHMFLIGVPIALFARRAFGTVEAAEQLDHV